MALLAGATHAQAAEQSGVSERTVRRRLADPDFAERYAAESRDMFDKHTMRLLSGVPVGHSTLIEVARDPSAPATARVNAGKALIHLAREYSNDSMILARLAQLEAAVARKQAR